MPASKIQADRVKNALTHPNATRTQNTSSSLTFFPKHPGKRHKLQSDDHSVLEPPLPIPNRTVKRDRANDSALACVKVGHRQTHTYSKPRRKSLRGFARLLTYSQHHAPINAQKTKHSPLRARLQHPPDARAICRIPAKMPDRSERI